MKKKKIHLNVGNSETITQSKNKMENKVKPVTDIQLAKRFVQTEKSAKDRGKAFNLKLGTMRRLMNTQKCFFTGVQMNTTEGHPFQRTFDRIDNNKGYVEGNVVACTKRINNMKGDLSVQDIVSLYKALQKKNLI